MLYARVPLQLGQSTRWDALAFEVSDCRSAQPRILQPFEELSADYSVLAGHSGKVWVSLSVMTCIVECSDFASLRGKNNTKLEQTRTGLGWRKAQTTDL